MSKIIIYTNTNEIELDFSGNLEKELRDKIQKKGLMDVVVGDRRIVLNCAAIESYEIESDVKPTLAIPFEQKPELSEKEMQYIKQPMLKDREAAETMRKQLLKEQNSVFSKAIQERLNPENQLNVKEIKQRGRKPKGA